MSNLDNLDEIILKAIKKGVGQFLTKVQSEAKENCPVDTGDLRNRINTKLKIKDGVIYGEVGTDVKYGIYVELGTGPVGALSSKILPKGVNPKYKSEGWVYKNKNGEFIYTKGQCARPFLYPAFKSNENKLEYFIFSAVKESLRGIKNG